MANKMLPWKIIQKLESVLLPHHGDAGLMVDASQRKLQDGVAPPIEIIGQGGDWVDFVVKNIEKLLITQ